MSDTSGISSRLGRAKRTLHEVREETECLFLVAEGRLLLRCLWKVDLPLQ